MDHQKLQTESLRQLNEAAKSEGIIFRAQLLRKNIDDDIVSMQRDGDDINSPARYKNLKDRRKAASLALEMLLAPPEESITT